MSNCRLLMPLFSGTLQVYCHLLPFAPRQKKTNNPTMNLPLIRYYDFNDFRFSTFYVTGMLENQRQSGYRFKIVRSIPGILEHGPDWDKYRSHLPKTLVFRATTDRDDFFFAIDGHDSAGSMGFHIPLLKKIRYLFKANYNRKTILEDSVLAQYRDKILPVVPMFPIRPSTLRQAWPRLRGSKTANWTTRKGLNRLRRLRTVPTLDQLRGYRTTEEAVDIFFVIAYYAHSTDQASNEFRFELIRRLRELSGLNLMVGFVSKHDLPVAYRPYDVGIRRYSLKEYLNCLASTKVGIYVRGPFDCISFKFGQLMAMGKPIAGQTLRNNRAWMYGLQNFDRQFAYDDPAELAQQAAELARDPRDRRMLRQSNIATFEQHLTPAPAVANLVSRLGLLGASKPDLEISQV